MARRIPATPLLIAAAFTVFALVVPGRSSTLLWGSLGPSWRRVILESNNPASMNIELGYGRLFGGVVGVGAQANLLLNRTGEDSTYTEELSTGGRGQVSVKLSEDKRLMVPLSLFLSVDPLAGFMIRPVVKISYGFAMMGKVVREYTYSAEGDDPEETKAEDSGLYLGTNTALCADAVFNLIESVGFFAGVQYDWAKLRRRKPGASRQYYEPPPGGWGMSGIGLRAGVRLAF